MDECVDNNQCDNLVEGRLKCMDDPKTKKKRCMVGATLGQNCTNYGNRNEYVVVHLNRVNPSFF